MSAEPKKSVLEVLETMIRLLKGLEHCVSQLKEHFRSESVTK